MKRIIFLAYVSLLWMGSAFAENSITVGSAGVVTIPKGGQGIVSITYAFDQAYHGFQLTLDLTNTANNVTGIIENEKPIASLGFSGTDHTISSTLTGSELNFLSVSFTNAEIPTSGTLINIPLVANENATEGDTYTVKLKGMEFGRMGETPYRPADITFTIQIGAPLASVVLNETATTAPTSSSEAVNVTVNRTIKADTWSTLCLPFDMTTAQVKEAFGDDVKLAELDSWSFTGTAPNIDAVQLKFASTTSITANRPCLIRVSNLINSFDVNNVEIVVEDLPEHVKEYKIGKKTYRCSMYGYYSAGVVEDGEMFLSGNTFYVSKGTTNMKGYRATFAFEGITLPTDNDEARIEMSFDEGGEVTKNESLDLTGTSKNDSAYSLSGQYIGASGNLNRMSKGIYVVNGEKIIVK